MERAASILEYYRLPIFIIFYRKKSSEFEMFQ